MEGQCPPTFIEMGTTCLMPGSSGDSNSKENVTQFDLLNTGFCLIYAVS